MKAAARRLILETVGWILVVGGIAALALPGPGLLMIFAGMVILSQQYEWAERRLESVKEKALVGARESVETWPRIALSVLGGLTVFGFGIFWTFGPEAPKWWPIDDTWWRFGGWGPGLTLMLSGLIALGLIVYSYRRFRTSSPTAAD